MLILSKTHFSDISTYAERSYPHECCGGIIGTRDGDNKRVLHVMPIQNNWVDIGDETTERRFMISSDDYQLLEQAATSRHCNLLGIYHSHPNQPAIPSQTDGAFAWPFFSYPIISVIDGVATEVLSYEFDTDSQLFSSEDILIQ